MVRALAARLQEEWELPRDSVTLKRARAIDIPKLKPGSATIHAEAFVFDVEISADGKVLSARFAKPPEQAGVGRVAWANVLRSRFRPAFDGAASSATGLS